jgi:hypothetical protein
LTAGTGGDISQIISLVIDKYAPETPTKPKKELSDIALSQFAGRRPIGFNSRSVQEFERRIKDVKVKYDNWNYLLNNELPRAKKYFNENKAKILKYIQLETSQEKIKMYNELIKIIERNEKMTAKEKKIKIEELEAKMTDVARKALNNMVNLETGV